MSLNQNIRFKAPNPSDTNNPQGLYSYLLTGQNLSGAGVPNNNAGTINSRYIDTLSGIEYIKNDTGTWEPYIDYSGFAPPPPPPTIPDPLEVGELRADTIKGKTADSFTLDAGLNGDINLTLGPSNSLNINSGNTQLTGNGNIIAGSLVSGYQILADTGGGKSINLNPNANEISIIGSAHMNIKHNSVGQNLQLQTNDGNIIMNTGAGSIIANATIGNTTNNSFIIEHQTTGEDVEIKAESVGAGNVILRAGTGGGQVQTTENLSLQGKDLINVEKVQHTTASIFTIENTTANQDVLIKSAGVGNIRFNSSGGQNVFESEATFNPFGLSTSSINGSNGLTENRIMAIESGSIIFGKVPQTIIFSGINIGVNGVNYLDCFNIDPNPGQVPICPILNGGKIRRVEAALLFDTPWTWGGATTANIDFGYIALSSPVTTANWTPLFSLSMEPTLDYYYTNAPDINANMPPGKLGCRLNIVGATPTASTAEIIIKVQLY